MMCWRLSILPICSCYEIYGGKVFDLLNGRKKLEVREDGRKRVQVRATAGKGIAWAGLAGSAAVFYRQAYLRRQCSGCALVDTPCCRWWGCARWASVAWTCCSSSATTPRLRAAPAAPAPTTSRRGELPAPAKQCGAGRGARLHILLRCS